MSLNVLGELELTLERMLQISWRCIIRILCYVVLCYVMLCYVMLCYVMLCYVTLRYVTLRYVMLCYVMLYYVILCYVMLCYVMLRYVTLRYVIVCLFLYLFVCSLFSRCKKKRLNERKGEKTFCSRFTLVLIALWFEVNGKL